MVAENIPPTKDALQEALALSTEILKNVELVELPLANIALKASALSYKFVDKVSFSLYSGWRKENDHDYGTSKSSPPPERR